MPGVVLAIVDPNLDDAATQTRLNLVGTPELHIPDIHVWRLRLPAGGRVDSAIAGLRQMPEIVMAEPDYDTVGAGQAEHLISGVLNPNWKIAAIADFSGDGLPDLVEENLNQHLIYCYYIANYANTSGGYMNAGLNSNWYIVGPK